MKKLKIRLTEFQKQEIQKVIHIYEPIMLDFVFDRTYEDFSILPKRPKELRIIKLMKRLRYKIYEDSTYTAVLHQIRLGVEWKLSPEEIEFYVNLNYNVAQMEQVRIGVFLYGLENKIVRLYANPYFDARQMYQIRIGGQHGLLREDIDSYAKPEIPSEQMEKERIRLEEKVLYSLWYEGKVMVPRAKALDILVPISSGREEFIRCGKFFE